MRLANLEVSIEYNVVEDRVLDWFLGNCCDWPDFPYYLGGGSNSNDENREGSPAVRLLPSTGGAPRSEALLNGDSVVAKDDGAGGDRCFDALNTSPSIGDEESLGVETVWIPDEEEEDDDDDDDDDDVDCFNEVRDDHPDASTSPPPYSASSFPLYPASAASLFAEKQPSSTRLAAAKIAADNETISSSSSTASSSSKRRRPRPKSVHFCPTVQVCTYEIVLSHHPCCRDGMAIECGWAHGGVKRVDLEVLERQCRHRPERELYLDFFARRQRLLRVTGLSDFDLDAAAIGMMDCWSH